MKHFTFSELGAADAPAVIRANLRRLCEELLDPLRAYLQLPLIVTSGYRSEAHNRRVGGVPGSDHTRGMAVDFFPRGISPAEAHRRIREALETLKLPFDQLIFYPAFIHLSLRPKGENRKNMFYAQI